MISISVNLIQTEKDRVQLTDSSTGQGLSWGSVDDMIQDCHISDEQLREILIRLAVSITGTELNGKIATLTVDIE